MMMKPYLRNLAIAGGTLVFILILFVHLMIYHQNLPSFQMNLNFHLV